MPGLVFQHLLWNDYKDLWCLTWNHMLIITLQIATNRSSVCYFFQLNENVDNITAPLAHSLVLPTDKQEMVATLNIGLYVIKTLQWRHNGRNSVSNHQPHDCLLNRLFRRRSKKTSKLRVTGLCAGNSPGTGEFPAQMASYAANVSIWWRHHDIHKTHSVYLCFMTLPKQWLIFHTSDFMMIRRLSTNTVSILGGNMGNWWYTALYMITKWWISRIHAPPILTAYLNCSIIVLNNGHNLNQINWPTSCVLKPFAYFPFVFKILKLRIMIFKSIHL